MIVILVVEDGCVRGRTVTALEEARYKVIEAASGGEAATTYRERFPDLPVLYVIGYAGRMRSVPGEIIISEPYKMAQVIGVLGTWAACVNRHFDERFIPARLHPG